jgi:UPF0755 protein
MNNNQVPESNKKKNHIKTFLIILVIFIVMFIISAIALYGYYSTEVSRPLKENYKKELSEDQKTISLNIKKGMTIDEISQYLYSEGLIKAPEILKIYMFLNKDKVIQAGLYIIDINDKNLEGLINEMQKGSFEKKLTFLEGWRVSEYEEYLKETMGDEFAESFISSSYIKEGYMFPDTYIIESDYDPANLASWMRNTFDKKVTTELREKAEFIGLTLEEVVILASILEREMNIKSERPVVAGILVKRLMNDWPLQADATVQYAKGKEGNWWPKLTGTDVKETESEYNTYNYKGLPPGPICNPSLNSIESVINYKETDYWFYISDNKGITRYAETLDQHNENINKYLR